MGRAQTTAEAFNEETTINAAYPRPQHERTRRPVAFPANSKVSKFSSLRPPRPLTTTVKPQPCPIPFAFSFVALRVALPIAQP